MSKILSAVTLTGFVFAMPAVAFADTNISAAGSTALQPLVTAAAQEYQAKHSGTNISVTGGGSKTGLSLVASKAVDLGDSDILAPADAKDLIDHKVAVIGFSVVLNPASGVSSLTKKQIQDIFSGKTTNFKDVGGKDQAITVINRPASSGTRAVFLKTIMGDAELSKATLTEDATGTVVQKVMQSAGAISYASFSGTHNKSGIVEAKIDGANPDEMAVESGKYPFWSYEHIYTNGQPSAAVDDFIKYIADDGDLMKKTGYIVVKDMKVSETNR